MKATVSQQTTVLQQTYINKTVAFRRVDKNKRPTVGLFLRFLALPTVKSILRLKSHSYNQYSLLYPGETAIKVGDVRSY
jgi:hypothetical protein